MKAVRQRSSLMAISPNGDELAAESVTAA
jgi:hypothetical protein